MTAAQKASYTAVQTTTSLTDSPTYHRGPVRIYMNVYIYTLLGGYLEFGYSLREFLFIIAYIAKAFFVIISSGGP